MAEMPQLLDRMANLEKLWAILLPLDLTNDSSIVQVNERIHTEQSRINILVNNAGYGSYGAAREIMKAVGASRPKIRYAVGSFAKPLIFMSNQLPDRFNDWFMTTVTRSLLKL